MVLDLFKNVFVSDPTIKRHLVKSVSWRVLGSLDTLFLGWFVTGQVSVGAQIGALELITKMVFYFVHERVWHRITFGLPTRTSKANKIKQDNEGKLFAQHDLINRTQRELLNGHKAYTIWLTGLSGSGKSTIAKALEAWFYEQRVADDQWLEVAFPRFRPVFAANFLCRDLARTDGEAAVREQSQTGLQLGARSGVPVRGFFQVSRNRRLARFGIEVCRRR